MNVTPEKKMAFLDALADCGNVRKAAEAVGLSWVNLYRDRRIEPEFNQAWLDAERVAVETVLEPEMMRRAVDGVDKPIYQGGKLVGSVTEYSDTLAIFLAKKHPKFRDRSEISGPDGGPIRQQSEITVPAETIAEAARILKSVGRLDESE